MRGALLAVVVLALAGCSADKPAAVEPVQVVADSGTLHGIVVTPAVVPVAGAKVAVLDHERTTTTDADGRFSFPDLAFGEYLIEVVARDFQTTQVAVTFAGATIPVRIQLAAGLPSTPYFTEFVWDGFIECSTNYVAVCGALNEALSLTSDTYTTWFDTSVDITHLQTEMVWESTQELGDAFWFLHRYGTPAQHEQGLYEGSLAAQQGASPLLVKTDVKRYNDHGVGEAYEFVIAVFSGTADEVPLVGATVSQDFQVFVHEFHGAVPAKDWRFTSGLPP